MMRIKSRRIVACIVAAAMCFGIRSGMSAKADTSSYKLKNPVINNQGDMIWDCIYFGNYWQNDTNGDGSADKSDEKETIKWRILSVDGNDAFVIADKNIECKPFNTAVTNVTWEDSTIRSWLNGYDSRNNLYKTDYSKDNFINDAFSEKEKNAIKQTKVINEDNPYDGTDCGPDTYDKIYLLSIQEAENINYGFESEGRIESKTRMCKSTPYVQQCGIMTSDSENSDYGYWWLRTSGASGSSAANVISDGFIGSYRTGDFVKIGVRPVLHLNLSDSSIWSYAGEVSSNGEVYEVSPTAKPEETEKPAEPAVTPNAKIYPNLNCKKTFTKNTASKKFGLNIQTNSNGKVTYKSLDNSIVKVSESGIVSIVGCGTADINVSIGETLSCYPVSANIKINVVPEKISNFKAKNSGKKLICTWKKRNLKKANCLIQASFSSKFKNTKQIKPYPALKSGKTTVKAFSTKRNYYIRAKIVLKSGKKQYQGAWSKAIKVKCK